MPLRSTQIRTNTARIRSTDVGQTEQNLRIKRAEDQVSQLDLRVLRLTKTQSGEITPADSPYAASENELVVCDMSTGDITVTLPTPCRFPITVKRSGSGNTLTVDPGAGRTINGSATITIGGDGTALTLQLSGTQFHIT